MPDQRVSRTAGPSSQRPRPLRSPSHLTGRLGERLAVAHLERRGFRVLARNARTRAGEIDLIVFDGQVLAFVEVKSTRQGARREPGAPAGSAACPLERLGPRQRARLRRLAVAWLARQGSARPAAATIRFDAIGVVVGRGGELLRLDHVEGAW
ncbi:MAG: YraN family protein [Solirubrobacteraceae bacterium]